MRLTFHGQITSIMLVKGMKNNSTKQSKTIATEREPKKTISSLSSPMGSPLPDAVIHLFKNLGFMLEYKLYETVDRPIDEEDGGEFAGYAKEGLLLGEIGYILGSHRLIDSTHKFWFDFLKNSLVRSGVLSDELKKKVSSLSKDKSQKLTNICSRLARLEMLEVTKRGIYKTRYRSGPNIYYSPMILKRLRVFLRMAKAGNCWSNGRVTLISDASYEERGLSRPLIEGLMNDLNTAAKEIHTKSCQEWYRANGKKPVDIENLQAKAEGKHGTFDSYAFEKWLQGLGDAIPILPMIVIDPNPSALGWRSRHLPTTRLGSRRLPLVDTKSVKS